MIITGIVIVNGGYHFVGVNGVTKIMNESSDNKVRFSVWRGENKVSDIINCPVEVQYEGYNDGK